MQRLTLNAIPFTGKVESLSKFDVKNPIQRALRDDMAKVIDYAVSVQFNSCQGRVEYVTDTASIHFSTDGTNAGTWGSLVKWDDYFVKEVVDYLEGTLYAPKYDGDGYVAITSPRGIRGLHDHLEQTWKYTKYEIAGEVGRYYGCRFIKTTNTGSTQSGTLTLDDTIGNTGQLGSEGYFFGDDTVIEAVVVPEEIRMKIPTNFGRSKAVAWYALLGFKIIWESGDPQVTIVKAGTA